MKNYSILWYQPASLDENDIILQNGAVIEDPQKSTELFRIIKQLSDKVIDNRKPWFGKVNSLYFIKGHLSSKDCLGRKMSFMYVSDKETIKKDIFEELSKYHLQPDENTTKCIKGNRSRGYSFFFVPLVLIIFFLLFIFFKYGK